MSMEKTPVGRKSNNHDRSEPRYLIGPTFHSILEGRSKLFLPGVERSWLRIGGRAHRIHS